MLANRVQETTTTTGTGNLTLAGASANYRSFNSAFGTNSRFSYFVIDDTNNSWEEGIGYLSSSTTLVRDNIVSSSNSDAAVNFGAGTKTVFNGPGSALAVPAALSQYAANSLIASPHVASTQPINFTITADRVYYVPFLVDFYQTVDAIVGGLQTAAGTKMRYGIYDLAADNTPGNLIVQTADLTPVSTSLIDGVITATKLLPGWYYLAMVSDGADTIKASDHRYLARSILSARDVFYISQWSYAYESAPSWTTLPASAGTLTLVDPASLPRLLLRFQ